jgi:putative peptidoglycan lipid II flippase
VIAALRNRSVNWRILTDSAFVAACLSAVKAAGAIKVVMMARTFGTADELDAFLVAFLLPAFFAETIAGSLATALIPALVDVREKSGRLVMFRLIRNCAAAAVGFLAIGAILLVCVSPLLLTALGSGFAAGKQALTQSLFLPLVPMIPMAGLSIVWRAALNAEESYAVAALAPGCVPLTTIAAMLWATPANTSVWVLVVATLTGIVLEVGCLGIAMWRSGMPLMPRWSGFDPATRRVGQQHLPLIAVSAIANGNILIDQSMAATLGSGSVSALSYGTRLSSVLAGIAGGALSTAALPQFARMIASGDWAAVRRTLATYTRLVALTAVPATLALIVLTPVLVRLIFLRGAFTEEAAATVSLVQRFALLQLPVVLLSALLMRMVASMQANALLVRMAVVALVVNTVGDFVLIRWIGLTGIPAASGLVQLLTLGYLVVIVWKRIRT